MVTSALLTNLFSEPMTVHFDLSPIQLVLDLGCSYEEKRGSCSVEERVKTFEFSSVRKSMTVVIRHKSEKGEVYRVLTKGAAEKVLDMCKYIVDEQENVSLGVIHILSTAPIGFDPVK